MRTKGQARAPRALPRMGLLSHLILGGMGVLPHVQTFRITTGPLLEGATEVGRL